MFSVKWSRLWGELKETFNEARKDNLPQLGAALSFYTVFSLAPMLLLVIAVAGFFWGEKAVSGRVYEELRGLVGPGGGQAIESMIESARKPAGGAIATAIGIITLLVGATGVFVQLQEALNTVWEVTPKKESSWLRLVRSRFLSFATVLGIGFLLLVSLVLSAALSAFTSYVGGALAAKLHLAQVLNFLLSLAVITLLFAFMYKVLPDVKIAWRGVWVGGFATAVLFTAGKFLVGLYLGRSSVASAYGAAGTVLVIFLWVYYTAQITLIGAEFTQVYARARGLGFQKVEERSAAGNSPSRHRTDNPVAS